jgi:hypothetical protein
MALMLKENGIGYVVNYLKRGEGKVEVETFSDMERQKMSMLLTSFSSPEQLKDILYDSVFFLDKNATTHALYTKTKDENGQIDQQIIIQKLNILAKHGFDLTNTRSMIYGQDNNFNFAVRYGLNDVVEYLANRGIQPTSSEELWSQCARHKACDSDTVDVLERFSYTPPESFSKD